MKNQYSTPQLFASDVVRDGTTANAHMMQMAMQAKPLVKGFATGKELWNEKTRVDMTLYDFHKAHDTAPTWTQASEDDAMQVLSRMANYFARFQKSEPVVQQASRIMPEDVANTIKREIEKRGGQASSSKKPSKSGFGILAALAAFGVYLFMKRK